MQEIVINITRISNCCCVILWWRSKNSVCAHIHSNHIGWFLASVSNTIYIDVDYEIFMTFNEITVDARYGSVLESQF